MPDSKTPCPLCKSNQTSLAFLARDFISKKDFSVVTCHACKVSFTWPQPADIENHYPENYRRFAPFTRWLMQVLYRRAVRSWVGKLGFRGRCLEVGSGNGWMLKALHEEGWQVVGFERNEEQANRVSKETGFKVFSGSLSQIAPHSEAEKFDLILLFNVIEHLSIPDGVLKECRELLSAKGRVLLNAPNFLSWQAQFSKAKWAHLDVPRHLFHFSKPAFESLFSRTGLALEQTHTVSWVHDPYGWDQSLLNKLGFKENRLTQELTRESFVGFLSPSGLWLGFFAALAALPSIGLALLSWAFKRGALIEVWAKKN